MECERVVEFVVQIRPAKKEDMVAVASLIQELADFQNIPNGPKLKAKDFVPHTVWWHEVPTPFTHSLP